MNVAAMALDELNVRQAAQNANGLHVARDDITAPSITDWLRAGVDPVWWTRI